MSEHEPAQPDSYRPGTGDQTDGLDLGLTERGPRRGTRRRKKRGGPWGCLIVLVIVAGLVGGLAWASVQGLDWVREQLNSEAEDYPGPGSGDVTVEVNPGDGTGQIARTLKEAGVIASVQAFTNAAAQRSEEVATIQPGHYPMLEEMKAADAVAFLVDPENAGGNRVVIPEGFRANQIVARLVEKTGIAEAEFEKVLDAPDALELPTSAEGDPEGYLFPASYSFGPDDTATDMLKAMVDRYNQVAADVPVSEAASTGFNEHDFMTIASIIEKEVNRDEDMPSVAEVIFNRLDGSCVSQGIPKGLLQMDSTVHFLSGGGTGSVYTSAEARSSDSPYNTYKQAGLPPGPIASPGKKAMQSVLKPSDKGYCYFVAVNLDTGETRFAKTDSEHNANRKLLSTWCKENSGRCG